MAERRRWPWVLAALVAAGFVYAGYSWRGDSGAGELARQLEAEKLESEGFEVALQQKGAEIDEYLERQATLTDEAALLQEQLDQLRASTSTRTESAASWRSNPMTVSLQDLARGLQERLDEAHRQLGDTQSDLDEAKRPGFRFGADRFVRECEFELPAVSFEVRGSQATLQTEGGNYVIAGAVGLYLVDPPPEELLGLSPFQVDVSEFFHRPPEPRPRRRGWYGGFQWDPDPESAVASSDPTPTTISLDEYRFAGGVEWRFRRLSLRLGGHTDGGLDVGVSWHGLRR